MAFDWTKVEGFSEDMSAEEKLALLENFDPPAPAPADPEPAPSPSGSKAMVSKAQFDKVASELATVKKQLRGKMSEDEQKELDRQNEREEMETELKALRREKTLAGYKAAYLSLGYDEQTAEDASTSMVDGDMENVFALMKKHSIAAEKALRAKILSETPVPPAGDNLNDEAKKREEEKQLRAYFGLPS